MLLEYIFKITGYNKPKQTAGRKNETNDADNDIKTKDCFNCRKDGTLVVINGAIEIDKEDNKKNRARVFFDGFLSAAQPPT